MNVTVELTRQELEVIIRALSDMSIRRDSHGLSHDQVDALRAKLEAASEK